MSLLEVLYQFSPTVQIYGNEAALCCPFHDDSHPSFNFNLDNECFYCHSCHAKGKGVLALLERLGYADEELLDAYVGALRDRLPAVQEDTVAEPNIRDIAYAQQLYSQPYSWIRTHTLERSYLFGRGFLPQTLEAFHIRVLQNIPHHTIFIPLSYNSYVYGYQRRSADEYSEPKYLTMTGLKKTEHLYGMQTFGTLLLCEGVTDVWKSWQLGHTNTVATLGSMISQKQWKQLMTYATGLICAYHYDKAGHEGYRQVQELAQAAKLPCTRLMLLDDIAKSDEREYLASYRQAEMALDQQREALVSLEL